MKSPKFYLRETELRQVIDADRLQFTWTKKLRLQMRRQYVPDPLEFLDFHVNIKSVSKEIATTVFRGHYIAAPPSRYLVEKSKGLCRQLVLPQVRDALVLQCLSDALWHDIKKHAPTNNSFFEINDSKFNASKDGSGYGPFQSWLRFQKEIFKFSKDRKFIVITDIANYYDFIRYDHLRNTIAGILDVRESVLDFLIYVLSELLWQPDYMPRIEIGLPQLNFDAPRLLAHCFLYELDKVAVGFGDVDYVRFMDDIDIGVDSIEKAKQVIKDIDLTLQSRHVRLNSGKTQILSNTQAARHFKIRENKFIERLEERFKTGGKTFEVLARKKGPKLLLQAYNAGVFTDGNGDKVLKRLIGIFGNHELSIPDEILHYILYRRPSCREALFKWFSKTRFNSQRVRLFIDFAISKHVVDDACLIETCKALVDVRVPEKSKKAQSIICDLALHLASKGPFGTYGAIWLLSKYGTAKQLVDCVETYQDQMISNPLLCRLVGGLSPRIFGTPYYNRYFNIVQSASSPEAMQVLNFHTSLRYDQKLVRSIYKILSAPDISKPNGISNGKLLVLMSVTQGTALPGAELKKCCPNTINIKKTFSIQPCCQYFDNSLQKLIS
jgi:hypothetical protein